MNIFGQKVLRIANIFFVISMVVIILVGLVIKSIYICESDSPAFTFMKWHDYLIAVLVGIFYCALIFKREQVNRIPFQIVVAIYFLFSIIYITFFPLKTFSDMDQIYQAALNFANGNFEYFRTSLYFSFYPNNVFLSVLYGIILFVFPKSVFTLKVLNTILVVGITCISEKIVQLLFPNKYRNLFYIFSLSFLSVLLYVNHVYSDLPFVFFTLLGLYLYLKNPERIVFTSILMGVIYELRPQAIFYMIAMFVHYVFFYSENIKKIWKPALSIVLGVVSVFALSYCCNIILPNTGNSIPSSSYIYMAFNEEKFGFQDGSHSTERTMSEVKNRLVELGPVRTSKIVVKKIFWTWSEGTYQAARYSFGSDYQSTDEKYLYQNALQKKFQNRDMKARIILDEIMRGQYMFMLAISIFMFTKKHYLKYTLFELLFLANFVFYIFWEIKSRYLLPLYPLMIIFAFIFLIEVNSKCDGYKKIEAKK